MKKKFLISACALAACLGACTNEDILNEQTVNSNAGNSAVVGADLVSNGMDIVLSGDAETRAVNGAWEDKDEFGLAWYNYTLKTDANDYTGIFGPQDKGLWATGGIYDWSKLIADNSIYANHLFSYNSDSQVFKSMGDIYQGAYFLYYPYATQSSGTGVLPKTISVNDEAQTGNFTTERFNKALHISAQDFISVKDLKEDHILTKEFVLSPAVNVFAINATAGDEIKGEGENVEFFKNMAITEMTIDAGAGNDVFAKKAILRPLYIPHVVRDAVENIDTDKTIEALDAAAKIAMAKEGGTENGQRSYLTVEEKTNLLTTKVYNDYTIANLGEEGNYIRAFAFPIAKTLTYVGDEAPELTITVGLKDKYNLGTFTIADPKTKNRLKEIFTQEKYLTEIFRDDNGAWSFIGILTTLSLSEFTPLTNKIESEEQWNDLVKVYDALTDMGVKFTTTPVFTLGADVTFKGTNGTIATPKNVNIALTAYPYTMTIDAQGTISWPKNLLTNSTSVITVTKGTTLNVGMEEGDPEIVINSDVRNNGIINVGPKATLGQKDNGNKVTNNNRIVVKYGAYVYPASGVEGIIAYRMEKDQDKEVARINKLMLSKAAAENKGIASINTLIIPAGKTLDLDAQITTKDEDGDRYEEDQPGGETNLKDLANITIELEGGTIENKVYGETGEHNTVKAVIAKEGATSKMIDVQTSYITIEKGTLTIDAYTYPMIGKNSLRNVKTILNQAGTTLNVATIVHADKVDNFGAIDVEAPYTLFYGTLQQVNGDGERGKTVGNVKPEPTDPTPSYDALTQAVIDSFNGVGFATAGITTYQDVIANIKVNGTHPGQAAFLTALNAWRADKMLDPVTKDTIAETDLKQFEAISGYKFSLN